MLFFLYCLLPACKLFPCGERWHHKRKPIPHLMIVPFLHRPQSQIYPEHHEIMYLDFLCANFR